MVHPESVAEESLPDSSPLTATLEVAGFPYDPLEGPSDPRTGARIRLVPGRRAAMDRAAARVLEFMEEPASRASLENLTGISGRWSHEAQLLLDRRLQGKLHQDVHLPSHISASLFVDLGADPAAVLAQLRRPVPREPGISARKGTKNSGR